MSQRLSENPSRSFTPSTRRLEDRTLMNGAVHAEALETISVTNPDSPPPTFPLIAFQSGTLLPRTGGIFAQSGSSLAIGVGQRSSNHVQISDDHAGDVQAEWNGGPVHSFTGVFGTSVEIEHARKNNQVTINLTGQTQESQAIESHSLQASGSAAGLSARVLRTSGTAVQTGSLLTVVVNKPTSNNVQLTNDGGGTVQVEWNGAATHSFSGVTQVVVKPENGTNERITLIDPIH